MTAICILAVVLAFIALSLEGDGDGSEEQVVWDLEPVQLKTRAAVPTTGPSHGEQLPTAVDLERVRRAA